MTDSAGEVLVELDPTMNEAERDHLRSDFVAARAKRWFEMQWQFLIEQTAEQRAKLAVIDSQEAQKLAVRNKQSSRDREARIGHSPCKSGPICGRSCWITSMNRR